MKATERLWRTADGALVRDGDPDAATLAYAAGDEVAPADEAKVPDTDQAEEKAADKPADKSRRPVANKARGRSADK